MTRIGISGSFARGKQTCNGEIDVLADFAPEYATLKNVVGLACVNMTVDTTLGNELNLIRETQRTNLTERIIEFLKGRFPASAQNLTTGS
nr:hypothetical protein [uncultured Methanoregula sp.]